MRLGLGIDYTGYWVGDLAKLAIRAEALGYESLWTSEAYGTDALSPLAYVGGLTKRIRLGTAVAQLAARTPAALAMAAQTIDALAGRGRMMLGIGVSGPQIVEGWYGQPWGRPNIRLRDYVAIIRKILDRAGPVAHDGREIALPYQGPGSCGLGKPLKSVFRGNRDIPILLGTVSPLNVRMTAEIADGWIGMHMTPASLPHMIAAIDEGLARRSDGRQRKDFRIQAMIGVHCDPDVKAALESLKPGLAIAIGGMGTRDKNYHADMMRLAGFAEAADRIQDLFLAGRKQEAAAAVPDDYLDEEALVGPPDRLRERAKRWREAGLDLLMMHNAGEAELDALAALNAA